MWVSFNSSYLEFVECLESFIHAFHQILNVSSYYLFLKYSLASSSSYVTPRMHILIHFMWPRGPLGSASIYLIYVFFFLFLSHNDFHCLVFNFADWFFSAWSIICLLIPLVSFSLQFLYFSAPEFLFGFFLCFLCLYQSFCFVRALFLDILYDLPFLLWASLKKLP